MCRCLVRLVNVMMDNVSRLTMLKRSILRHSGRKTSNCHAILHDESSSSESAARWLENLKREALYDDIPYIDEDDPDPEPAVGGDNDGADGEDEGQAANFSFGKIFRGQGRRKKSVEVRVPQS